MRVARIRRVAAIVYVRPLLPSLPGAPMVAALAAPPTRSKVRPHCGTASSRRYERRRPEKTPLYKVVAEHLEGWLENRSVVEQPVSAHVERELRSYLTCGILCFGFGRARCASCGQGFVVAFSCKGRGVCPSCNGRRMAQTAAHLVDRVIPPVPVRQWVVSVPKRLRGFLADRPQAVAAMWPPTCSLERTVVFRWTQASGSRSLTAMCPAIFRAWNTSCDTAPGRPLRSSVSPSGVVRTAASPTSAMCCPDTRRPTGSARGAGARPRGRAPTASSNSHRLSSSTGSRIWSRRRGSTGTACRLETSQGCSPRITSSGPPSRRSLSGTVASCAMPRPVGMRSADMRHAEMPPATAATHATNRDLTTPPDAKGQTHGPGGGGVSAGVPGVWWRHPTHRVHYRSGADPEDTGARVASYRVANRSNHRPSRRPVARRPTGKSSCRSTTTGQSFRRRSTSCP